MARDAKSKFFGIYLCDRMSNLSRLWLTFWTTLHNGWVL